MQKLLQLWLASAFLFSPLPGSKHFNLKQLAPGVWAAIQNDHFGHAICNAGIVDLGDKTLVFDPFMTPEAARDLKHAAEMLTGRKVTLVINSHYHNDHIRGDQVFVPGAEIISTHWTATEIPGSEKEEQEWEKKHAEALGIAERKKMEAASATEKDEFGMWAGYYEGIDKSENELKITVPDISFSDSLWITGSKRSIRFLECKKGHTNSDLVMILPKEGIVFMGDLFFVNRHPYFGDGDEDGISRHIQKFLNDSALRIYVPGHGPVGGKKEMQILENYISDLQQLVKKGIAEGLTDSVIIHQPVPDAYKSWWFGRFYPANLEFLCHKLRGKSQ